MFPVGMLTTLSSFAGNVGLGDSIHPISTAGCYVAWSGTVF